MLEGSLAAAGIFFAENPVIKVVQNKLINSISLFFTQLSCREKLIHLHSFKSIILVSNFFNLTGIAIIICIQTTVILNRLSASNLLQKSVMDMVLQQSGQMPEVPSVILLDLL